MSATRFEDLLTIAQAAYLSGLPPDRLLRACRTGKLAASKIANQWLTTPPALDAYLSTR